jgi:phosphoglycerate kinase
MKKRTVRDINVLDKRVLVRVDFNVPLDKETKTVTNDSRIRATLPTIWYLIDHGARIILCSHLGRPEGKVVQELRLAPLGEHLFQLLGSAVVYTRDCIGEQVERISKRMINGDILLLENLRFHPEEEENDPDFAKALASLADIYVNDAFSAAHRAHASTVGVAQYLPAVAGLLVEKELDALSEILAEPEHPFAIVIGGAKVSSKIGMLESIIEKVDIILGGGSMANTFLKAKGHSVGASLVKEDEIETAKNLMKKAQGNNVKLFLPTDVIVAKEFDAEASSKTVSVSEVPEGWYIMDIGLKTIKEFSAELSRCKTVFWNGTLGVFEMSLFAQGTQAIASALSDIDGRTIIGGGDTAAAVDKLGFTSKMYFVSTGGGATLKFLEGKTLPGVAALLDKNS